MNFMNLMHQVIRGMSFWNDRNRILTPTSRNRTSRHSAPKSFIRFNASSRKLPEFSQPLLTRGRGISLEYRCQIVDCRGAQSNDEPLHSIHTCPWRYQSQYPSDDVDEHVGRIILVPTCPPQFVQTRPSDDKSGIDLEPVAPERWIFKIFFKLLEVTLDTDVRQIRHHMRDDFESSVFGKVEGLGDGTDGVTTVSVAGDVFVD